MTTFWFCRSYSNRLEELQTNSLNLMLVYNIKKQWRYLVHLYFVNEDWRLNTNKHHVVSLKDTVQNCKCFHQQWLHHQLYEWQYSGLLFRLRKPTASPSLELRLRSFWIHWKGFQVQLSFILILLIQSLSMPKMA